MTQIRARIARPPIIPSRNHPEELPDGDEEGRWGVFDRAARVRDDQARRAYDAMRWQRALAQARRLPDGRIAVDLGLVFG